MKIPRGFWVILAVACFTLSFGLGTLVMLDYVNREVCVSNKTTRLAAEIDRCDRAALECMASCLDTLAR